MHLKIVYNEIRSTCGPRIPSDGSSIIPRSVSDTEIGILRITGLTTEVAEINSKVLRLLRCDLVKFVVSLNETSLPCLEARSS